MTPSFDQAATAHIENLASVMRMFVEGCPKDTLFRIALQLASEASGKLALEDALQVLIDRWAEVQ